VARRLNEAGLKARSPAVKPIISVKNRKTRLTFAEEHVVWSQLKWSRVFFSDESKFNLVGSDGKQYVRRKMGERLDRKCVKVSAKFGGGSIMVWGVFSAAGVGPLVRLHGSVNSAIYKALLEEHLLPHLKRKKPRSKQQQPIFMQDNAPCHKSKIVMNFLEAKKIDVMKWPAQSPDLNPIENLWKILGDKISENKCKTLDELWNVLQDEWYKITPTLCQKLINSCNNRCMEVIKSKGLYTSY
jgi:transposase